jgi:hypothetical protein
MTAETTETGRAEPDNRTYGLHVWLCSREAHVDLRSRHQPVRTSDEGWGFHLMVLGVFPLGPDPRHCP